MRSLLARKPIPSYSEGGGEHGLHRTLGAGDLIMLAIGAVIGAGIFSTLGTAAAGEVNAAAVPAARTRTRTPRSASWSRGSSGGT
jgi:APA family basic amino acid/polyamine antiporter